ncbi:MAG: hypothetical protein ACT4P1_11380 [Sporichthyaceae bacterium]
MEEPSASVLQELAAAFVADANGDPSEALADSLTASPFLSEQGLPPANLELLPDTFRFTAATVGVLDAVVFVSEPQERSERWSTTLTHNGSGWRIATASVRPVEPPILLIEADGLGPLRIGMSGADAVATGFVYRRNVPEEVSCGTIYSSVGLPGILVDFRDDNPDLLDSILIKESGAATAEGLRVGSSMSEVKSIYGTRVRSLEGVFGAQYEVQGDGSRLVFADYDGVVSAILISRVPDVVPGGC